MRTNVILFRGMVACLIVGLFSISSVLSQSQKTNTPEFDKPCNLEERPLTLLTPTKFEVDANGVMIFKEVGALAQDRDGNIWESKRTTADTNFPIAFFLKTLASQTTTQAAGTTPIDHGTKDLGRVIVTTDLAPIQIGKRVIARARKGLELPVVEIKGEWYCVLSTRGWIHSKFIQYNAAKLAMPTEWVALCWSQDNHEKIEKLMKSRDTDPVSVYLGFKEISECKEGNDLPTTAQRQWLEACMTGWKPSAKELLLKDFKQAADGNDLHGCIAVRTIAPKVETNMLTDAAVMITAVKSRVFAGKLSEEFQPIWKVEPAIGRYLEGTYNEGSPFERNRMSLTAKAGFRLLRVTAQIENVSNTSDLPYFVWCLAPFKRISLNWGLLKPVESGKPQRLAVDELAFLLTPGGDWISCSHVHEGCSTLRGTSLTISSQDGSGAMVFSGTQVKQGRRFDADMIFSVPERVDDFRFLFLGATPVAVNIVK